MTNFLIPITVNQLPQIAELDGKQGMFILPDGSININKKDGTWMTINKKSDHAGILSPSDSISVEPGFAKWYWAGPGTYANAGNFVFEKFGVLSYNGSHWQGLEVEMPEVSVADEFKIENNEDAQGAQQINNWLINKVEGGEAGGSSTATEEIGSFDKIIGVNSVGNDSDSLNYVFPGVTPDFVKCKTNDNIADSIQSARIVKTGHVNLASSGLFKFCIGTFDGTIFHTSWISEALQGLVGWNAFTLEKKLLPGQIIGVTGITTPSGPTASIRFASNGGASANKLVQYSTVVGNTDIFNPGSYYSLYFDLYNIDYVESSTGEFNLKKSASKIVNDFAANNYKSSFFKNQGATVANAETNQSAGYAVVKLGNSVNHFLEKIEVRAQTAGSYNIVIGFIDQWNKLIEKKVLSVNLNAGINTLNINDIFEKDDVIGFKLPSKFPVNNAVGSSANLFVSADYGSSLAPVPGSTLPIKLFLSEYIKSNIATKSEVISVKNDLSAVENQFMKDGKKVKLIFQNDGTVKFEYSLGYSRTLFMGNSITLSVPDTGPNPGWWGTWGMSASEKNKDYCHIYLAKMKDLNPAATVNPVNISLWEYVVSTATGSSYTFDYSTLDVHFTNAPEVIFLKIGENVSWNQYFKNRFRDLMEYIILKNPTAIIKVCGVFWANSSIDSDMSAIAAEKGKQFIPLSQLDVPGSRSFIGAVVKGDDGQNHTVNLGGVAAHPGDSGMATMGNACFNSLGL
ncbi:hypothetical protein EG346_15875 [Chryseobacterium carnipullorum]|uniref:SGNH/GDSL hydrolase family protein n=1 Tax=Chryseobacterium carnipullorum TaxID=1124835 RepID=A0A376DU34_CHRCU|nr:hypothetical protein [Chryseobacterium carnipullorum]AZA49564.1 hypothetical protein EG346_15875 [Chryseobacterium carnipullorum]AZA64461.1 hypothetical protein EG345_06890 [Chryseobacterium carnipullorum]STC94830.1 Uncharacterised protein [Chryseobacterium carnipullorum]